MNVLVRQLASISLSPGLGASVALDGQQVASSLTKLCAPALQAINYDQKRGLQFRGKRPILGKPRPCPPGFVQGEPHKYRLRVQWPPDGLYTTTPLPIDTLAGRDPETGKVVVRTLGGAAHRKYRWIDPVWIPNADGSVREWRVMELKIDPLRSARSALLWSQGEAQWKTAAEVWREGDIVKVFNEIPKNPIYAKDGEVHPVGALAVGTKVHCLELHPRTGCRFLINAGAQGEVVRHLTDTDQVVINIDYKRQPEIVIDKHCMVQVGQCSNKNQHYIVKWCPQRVRWLGKRFRSGQWHQKDGYCGRKIKKPREAMVFEKHYPVEKPLYMMDV